MPAALIPLGRRRFCVNIAPLKLQETEEVSMSFAAPESLAEQIATHLAQRIIAGELQSGERIQEARVVNELDVSRSSVREALLILEQRYLISILPRRGALVAPLTEKHVSDLYDLYVNLLTMVGTEVARCWCDDDLEPLYSLWQQMQCYAADGDQMRFIDSGFTVMHAGLRICGNEYLRQVLEDLQSAVQRTYALAMRHFPAEIQHAQQFFADLLLAVQQRNTTVIPSLVQTYGHHQASIVLAALAEEAAECA